MLGTRASGRSAQNKGIRAKVQLADIKGIVPKIICIETVPSVSDLGVCSFDLRMEISRFHLFVVLSTMCN
jgi:hypothetical protein